MFYVSPQVTVVSVPSPTSNASQKSVTLPVNVALGQQLLAVQQPTPVSPVKVATSQSTTQVRWTPLLELGFCRCKNHQIIAWDSLFLCLLDLMASLSRPNIFRILSQCSPSLWAESVAPSLRPSFPSRASRTCSRFRCQAAGSTMSGSSQQQQLAAQDSPVLPAPAPYRQVTSQHTIPNIV